MRTGAEYKESLRDGRKLWVMGEGDIADVTTHPATAPVVDEYANWLDRHRDPEWRDVLLTKGGKPRAFEIPMTADDFIGLSNAIYAQSFITGGNITHTPGYGALIALGVLDQVKTIGGDGCHVDTIEAYRNHIAETGTFLTLTGGASVLGDRFRDPSESLALKVVRETDAGLIVNGRTGMHTSTPYANDVYVTTFGMEEHQRALFVVAANSPGASIVARAPSARYENKLSSPLSHRYDELDAQLWCDNVLVPWDRVFAYKQGLPPADESKKRDLVFSWLVWHHQSTWLAKADYTLGLTLAVVDSLGLKENPAITAQLIDLIIDCQTIRSCLTAANYEPVPTVAGYAIPNPLHMSSAMIYNFKTRQNMTNILRNIPGSSLVFRPTDTDLTDPAMRDSLERGFGGGSYTALQRSALLNLVWDNVSSGLDGREASFEWHANGGMTAWRTRVQRWFNRYNELANKAIKTLEMEMPEIDLDSMRNISFFGPGSRSLGSRPPAPPASPESPASPAR